MAVCRIINVLYWLHSTSLPWSNMQEIALPTAFIALESSGTVFHPTMKDNKQSTAWLSTWILVPQCREITQVCSEVHNHNEPSTVAGSPLGQATIPVQLLLSHRFAFGLGPFCDKSEVELLQRWMRELGFVYQTSPLATCRLHWSVPPCCFGEVRWAVIDTMQQSSPPAGQPTYQPAITTKRTNAGTSKGKSDWIKGDKHRTVKGKCRPE